MRHLIIRLEAPLMAFGGETIDNYGVIRRFPSASMLTGLLANALGLRRVEAEKHDRLQERLVFAARIDREPWGEVRLTDYQTVQIGDTVDLFVRNNHWVMGWTTRGEPDERAGQLGSAGRGPFTHLRYRDYWADMRVTVALRLEPEDGSPTLDELASALQEPARPLFIGRKPCLPSAPLFSGFAEASAALEALLEWPLAKDCVRREDDNRKIPALWPEEEAVNDIAANRSYMITDQRNWVSGLHGGGRWVSEGAIPKEKFGDTVESQTPPDKEEL